MSELEVISFHGIGNETPDTATAFYDVRQRQWLLQSALAWALGPRSDLTLGPLLQYSTTDSTPDRFISATRPYGFGQFGEAGLRLGLHHDSRDQPSDPHRGFLVDLSGSFYPALWDVTSPFATVAAGAATFVTVPIPMHPIVVLRGGAKQVFGEYPFHEAAFIGGRGTLRSLDAQRYAGDASLYGTLELRLPVAKFAFVLPLNVGLFATQDVGRVFVDGDSPGGWHTATGVGFWIGVLNPATSIRVCRRPNGPGPC
jgi:outer membrane protein assembly factor BamA